MPRAIWKFPVVNFDCTFQDHTSFHTIVPHSTFLCVRFCSVKKNPQVCLYTGLSSCIPINPHCCFSNHFPTTLKSKMDSKLNQKWLCVALPLEQSNKAKSKNTLQAISAFFYFQIVNTFPWLWDADLKYNDRFWGISWNISIRFLFHGMARKIANWVWHSVQIGELWFPLSSIQVWVLWLTFDNTAFQLLT